MDNRKLPAINMIGRQTNNEGFYAVPAPGCVEIDGSLDEWDLSGQIQSYADSAVKDVFSVKTAAMWDEEYLYLGLEWRDPYPLESRYHPLQDPTRGWMSDSAQLRFYCGKQASWFTTWCFEGDKPAVHVEYLPYGATSGNASSSHEMIVCYNGESGNADIGHGVLMAYQLAADGKGFTQEIRLPWRLLYHAEHRAEAGEIIRLGLDFHWGESGGSNRPIHGYCDNVQPGDGMRVFFWTRVDNWGDLTLMNGPVEKRIYREEAEEPEGTIPLRVKVPADAKTFTVTINTPDGKRVRNVAGGVDVDAYKLSEKDGLAEVEVLWDGLDESGKLVPAGEYVLKGITAGSLDGYWEGSFYNPGTPAWATPDTRGAWGADHTLIKMAATAGDAIILCSNFAEGGYGAFALNTQGERQYQKRWSDMRGTDALAANEKYVFLIPNDWSASGVELLRMDPATGRFIPFFRDGKEQIMPYPLTSLFGTEKPLVVESLALAGEKLYVRCKDHAMRIVHADSGEVEAVLPMSVDDGDDGIDTGFGNMGRAEHIIRKGMTVANGQLYYIARKKICRMDPVTGLCAETSIAVEDPSAITSDGEGCLYIADAGEAQQIIKCTPEGRELMRYGTFGGRPREGKYVGIGFMLPNGVAVDNQGRLWVTEHSSRPRRVSVWAPDGTLVKEMIGTSGYAGQDTVIHNNDPRKAFAEYNEMSLGEDGVWRVENVMYNPDPKAGLSFNPGVTPFDQGSLFFSEASGEKREYFAVQGWHRQSMLFMLMKTGDTWKTVGGIAPVANILNPRRIRADSGLHTCPPPEGEWADCDPMDIVFWNDYNGDGLITRDECIIVPVVKPSPQEDGRYRCIRTNAAFYHCTSGSIGTDDLSFYITKVVPGGKNVACVVKPTAYRDGGMPVYTPEGIREITDDYNLVDASYPLPGRKITVAFIEQEKKIYVAGLHRETGEILWRYLSPYHEVHGSHHAPMAKPGMMIGCLKVAGFAPDCGDSDIIMVRGNLGEDYYLTSDGEYINTLTLDCRLPGLAVPGTGEELAKISFRRFAGRGEHFSGRFTKHDDGVTRTHGGMPATEAGNIVRVEGLDSVRHFAPVTVTVTQQELVQADAANQERELARQQPKEPIDAAAGLADAKPFPIEKEGQRVKAAIQVASSSETLMLQWTVSGIRWLNGGKDWRILFKTGDCVDFQLSPTANREVNPAAGDFRLLIAPFEGKNIAVLMRQVEFQGVPAVQGHQYTSPVQTVPFDTVRIVEEANVSVTQAEGKLTIEATIPWAAIDMAAPPAGAALTGDAGVIVADADGKINTARIYRNNGATNLVNDQPGEARITPNGFGTVQF